MTDDCKGAEFVRVDNIEQLHLLRGSKYIQAKVGQAYKSVKNDLNSGRIVLFSGTGCQNNGLKNTLEKTMRIYIASMWYVTVFHLQNCGDIILNI